MQHSPRVPLPLCRCVEPLPLSVDSREVQNGSSLPGEGSVQLASHSSSLGELDVLQGIAVSDVLLAVVPTVSTTVPDSLTDVARLALSLRVAQNSCKGPDARSGATHRSGALSSF